MRETGVLKRRRATPVPAAMLIAGQAVTTRGGRRDRRRRSCSSSRGSPTASASRRRDRGDRLHGGVGDARVRVHRLPGLGPDRVPEAADARRPGDDAAAVVPLGRVHPDEEPEQRAAHDRRDLPGRAPREQPPPGLDPRLVRGAISGSDVLVLAAWALAAGALAAWRFSWLPSSPPP